MEADRPESQKEQRFPCPCDGENSDCIHCDGVGWTSHPVGLRARRTLSLSKPTPGRFRGKRELLFEQQFKREIPHLAAKTLGARKQGIRSTAFAEYINRLIEALDTGNSVSFWRGFVREVEYDDELAALQSRLQRLNLAASEQLQSSRLQWAHASAPVPVAQSRPVVARPRMLLRRRVTAPPSKSNGSSRLLAPIAAPRSTTSASTTGCFTPRRRTGAQ